MIPLDFAGIDLTARLGRYSAKAAIWLPALATALLLAHAALKFVEWPAPTVTVSTWSHP